MLNYNSLFLSGGSRLVTLDMSIVIDEFRCITNDSLVVLLSENWGLSDTTPRNSLFW